MGSQSGNNESKLDAKGRVVVPASILKQLPDNERNQFVLNVGINNSLVLYPLKAWEKMLNKLKKLNPSIKNNATYINIMLGNANPIELDSVNRFIVPKRLMQFAGIDKDVVFINKFGIVELLSKANYDAMMNLDADSFSALVQDVMGSFNMEDDE